MKQELRVYFRDLAKVNINTDKEVCQKTFDIVKNFHNVALYLHIKNEIDLSDLIKQLYDNNINVFVPYVKKGTKILEFRQLKQLDKITYDDAKIPTSQSQGLIAIDKLDAVIMACLAVNYDGYRLGYGGGYYDHTLSNYQGIKIGVVHDNCFTNLKFQNDYDIKLDYIVSEKRVIKVSEE